MVLCPQYFQCNDIYLVIGKSLLAGQSSSIKNELIFLNLYFLNDLDNVDTIGDAKDVENTKIGTNEIFINKDEHDEPDPAIVDLKNKRKIPSISDWPGQEDGRIATA